MRLITINYSTSQKFLEMGIRMEEFDLTRHELAVATMAVVPSSIDVSVIVSKITVP